MHRARPLFAAFVLALLMLRPAHAKVDLSRYSDPAIQELMRLTGAEEWEQAVQRGEGVAARFEASGDRSGVFLANQQLWLAYFQLGDTAHAAQANARSKHAYYLMTRDDPATSRMAVISYANALASSGQGDEALRLVDAELATLPDGCDVRDLLVWQKAMALYLQGSPERAVRALVEDAEQLERRPESGASSGQVRRFVAGCEWLAASELLTWQGGDEQLALRYGRQAVAALAPLTDAAGFTAAGSRSERSLLVRSRAAAGDYLGALASYDHLGTAGQAAYVQRIRYQDHALRGWYEDMAGQVDAALRDYGECVEALDR